MVTSASMHCNTKPSHHMVLHAAGPIEGRRHDWKLYCRSGVDESLLGVIFVGGKQYCICGDFGYNQRPFLEVPYQGSNLSAPQRAINSAMSKERVTVECYVKDVTPYWSTMDYNRRCGRGSRLSELYISQLCYLRPSEIACIRTPLPILPLRASDPGRLTRQQIRIHFLFFYVLNKFHMPQDAKRAGFVRSPTGSPARAAPGRLEVRKKAFLLVKRG